MSKSIQIGRILLYNGQQDPNKKLLKLLKVVDTDFFPKLSERSSLIDYYESIRSLKILAAFCNDELVGILAYRESHKIFKLQCLYIQTFAVLPYYRNHKIGSALLKTICNLYPNSRIVTRTWSTCKAFNLYRRFSFNILRILKNDRAPGIDTLYLVKDVK